MYRVFYIVDAFHIFTFWVETNCFRKKKIPKILVAMQFKAICFGNRLKLLI